MSHLMRYISSKSHSTAEPVHTSYTPESLSLNKVYNSQRVAGMEKGTQIGRREWQLGSNRKTRETSVRTAACKTERPWCILMTSLHTTHPHVFTAQQVSPHHWTPVPHPDLCHPPICFDLSLFPPSHLLIFFSPLLCWNTNNTMGLILVYLPKIPSSAGSNSARALLAAWCVCFVWAYVRVCGWLSV